MFGSRVKELRTGRGWTQSELGKKVGVNDSMITQIERGTKQASAPLVGEIAEVLGVTTDWLIYGDKTA